MISLESEREYLAASTDARLYRTDSRWACSRVHQLQWALEQRTGEWQVAQVGRQFLDSRRNFKLQMHASLELVLRGTSH